MLLEVLMVLLLTLIFATQIITPSRKSTKTSAQIHTHYLHLRHLHHHHHPDHHISFILHFFTWAWPWSCTSAVFEYMRSHVGYAHTNLPLIKLLLICDLFLTNLSYSHTSRQPPSCQAPSHTSNNLRQEYSKRHHHYHYHHQNQ